MSARGILFGLAALSFAAGESLAQPDVTASDVRRIAPTEDPFNAAMLRNLAPGMIIGLRISPAGIRVEQAYMLLTPKTPRAVQKNGERIVATLMGGGVLVSQTDVGDPATLVEEEFGERGEIVGRIIRQDERTVALALPTPSLVDTLEVFVTATGQTARFDVAKVMLAYCGKTPGEPSCQRARSPAEP